jgi:hypothetical protein
MIRIVRYGFLDWRVVTNFNFFARRFISKKSALKHGRYLSILYKDSFLEIVDLREFKALSENI